MVTSWLQDSLANKLFFGFKQKLGQELVFNCFHNINFIDKSKKELIVFD